MYLIGLGADNEEAELNSLGEHFAERMVNILALPFDQDRSILFKRLAGANIALMLSWHEGSALPAGRPLRPKSP